MVNTSHLQALSEILEGELFYDDLIKSIYATDASVYRILPLAVAYPKSKADIKALINFAKVHKKSLIPRTAGTSLAGQCVGEGIVVDVSKYFTKIISFDEKNRTITVQPGIVRDALNNYLKPFGLFFSPNTSTSNRCMIGGMVGNNSSGTTSIRYGVTRDKIIEMHTILSDGSEVVFKDVTPDAFKLKMEGNTLEASIYKSIFNELSSKSIQKQILENFPKPEIHRRNTGYAIDELIKTNVFSEATEPFNMCKLLSGSEGTLAFTTQITLKLDPLPPQEATMVTAHFNSIESCLQAVALTMEHNLYNCEMMDKTILDCTKHNKTQQENRSFIEGDPKAILMCEVRASTREQVNVLTKKLLDAIASSGLSYAYPILEGEAINKANNLRSAGLGLLGNIIGDRKSAACIEDTAVALPDLANYISEFTALMKGYNQEAIYYAHAGAGELHLRPVLNLKKAEDVKLFRKITTDVAHLVKKYGGSMSGEHGDGIVRAEFIPFMIGDANYQILKRIKSVFDADNIFNPGKIVDALPMDQNLRYKADREEPEIQTLLDFSDSLGILRATEKCNGSGDCRKQPEFGGTMCPSYRATKNEKDTTRARANALREFLTNSDKKNKFDHDELKTVFDLCLSCKACSSECPSSVDVASLKAEFLFQYQQANGVSLRTKLFAYNNTLNQFGALFPHLTNFMFSNTFTASILKKGLGIAKERSLPLISNISLSKYIQSNKNQLVVKNKIKTVYFFNDEFTNHLDKTIGEDALLLLTALNYDVKFVKHEESGRALISKGLLKQAQDKANKNVAVFKDLVSEETPLIGIEPSAILTFRDEYLKLADDKSSAKKIARHCFLIDEFLQNEIKLGHITASQFTSQAKTIKFHGHCHQKSLSNQSCSFDVLNLPVNYKVTIIASGCCGMAGSFGYEKEHYNVSMTVGEQTLFPAVRKSSAEVIIAATGTSCRHQIKDGTQREAKHPVTILREALI
ncbi:FAD-binding and (Fe-S)-binding domain-containing protein [Siansivirga zeaxanthinifaciens]|uniref:FAD-binding protein n=1 Tax=Siansivirga zeaxanthinifaciens CC-SAMT-1 TaxID=1454006 RepID=A0A0C5WAP6_9FLAO|nr:FAD-binding and (Fe-S)-binding domain-containing protein [Siansivirga zeaxanthinifaciens]AJR04173.1 FAD-binding protein [Siansivirga zeaxanthinifaciens CC-SAMT-1]